MKRCSVKALASRPRSLYCVFVSFMTFTWFKKNSSQTQYMTEDQLCCTNQSIIPSCHENCLNMSIIILWPFPLFLPSFHMFTEARFLIGTLCVCCTQTFPFPRSRSSVSLLHLFKMTSSSPVPDAQPHPYSDIAVEGNLDGLEQCLSTDEVLGPGGWHCCSSTT